VGGIDVAAEGARPVGNASVLRLEHLSKTFPGVKALIDVDLEVAPGEIHALVGQNGSGKSTLIKVLAGVHSPDEGARAMVNGRVLTLGNNRSAHELGIRFVHQDLGLVNNLTSVDNMALGFGYATGLGRRIKWRTQRANARAAIKHLVDDFPLDRMVGSLSVFQRTALAIARSLQDWSEHGALLVLDEPTATMPRSQVEHLFALLHRIRDRGTPVLLVTHHMEEVFAVADRVTVLRDGRRVETQRAAVLDTAGLVNLMTGGAHRFLERAPAERVGEVVMSLRGVSGHTAQEVNLDLRRGEILGVAGLSGSGRDELCSLLFGAIPRSGEMVVDERAVPSGRPDECVNRGIGLVPADRHRQGLIMSQSVRRNMTLTTLSDFVSRGRVRHRFERKAVRGEIDRFGVKTASTENVVSALSGGNQQKVVLAKWLRMRPKVLLLDEPTQGVDVAAQTDLHRLLIEAASAGTAVLVCSSDEHELSQLCDRVLVMRDGVVDREFAQAQITADAIVDATLQAKATA
jgi:ribose transport system ATP-binding protein